VSRFLRAEIAVLLAIVIGTLPIKELSAQGTAPPPFRHHYPFNVSRSCANPASAVCRRKPKAQSGVRFATDLLRIEGDSGAVRLEARQSTVADVLHGLGTAYNIRYHSPIVLDVVLNSTYSGSLPHVISRVLRDYNYVIKYDNSQVDVITIVGKIGERTVPAALTPTAVVTMAVTTADAMPARRRRNTSPNRPHGGQAGR
jgi:hypothetical protein